MDTNTWPKAERTIAEAFVSDLTGSPNTVIRVKFVHDRDRSAQCFEADGTIGAIFPEALKRQADGYGVFYFVNEVREGAGSGYEGCATDRDVTGFRALWTDHDDASVPEEAWEWHEPSPALVVKTSRVQVAGTTIQKGQAIWPILGAGVSPDQHRDSQRRLAAHYGSDVIVVNASRVLRLPGFLHLKREPSLVTYERLDQQVQRRTVADVVHHLPELPPRASQNRSHLSGTPVTMAHMRELLSFMDPWKSYDKGWRNTICAINNSPVMAEPGVDDPQTVLAVEWSRGKYDTAHKFDRAGIGRYANQDPTAAVEKIFKSMGPKDGGITYGSLYYLASEAGYEGAAGDDWIDDMNARWAVILQEGKLFIADTTADKLSGSSVDHFKAWHANKMIPVPDQNGDEKTVNKAVAWLKSRRRREYNRVVFEPYKPGPVREEAPGTWNLWRGFGVAPKEGDWSLLRKHILEVMCSGNREHFDYLIRWFAHGVQHPERPAEVVVATCGVQGAGKGVVFRTFVSLFGNHGRHVQGDTRKLTGTFNGRVGTTAAIFLDEAVFASSTLEANMLKGMITEPTFEVEEKFMPSFTVKNRLKIMIASNEKWMAPVQEGDRRYFVLSVPSTVVDQNAGARKAYWTALYKEIDHGGREAFLFDLAAMDLADFDIRAFPDTAARAEQKGRSQKGPAGWLYEVLANMKVGAAEWDSDEPGRGPMVSRQEAYEDYVAWSRRRGERTLQGLAWWSKELRSILGAQIRDYRPNTEGRARHLAFGPLRACEVAYDDYLKSAVDWDDLRGGKKAPAPKLRLVNPSR